MIKLSQRAWNNVIIFSMFVLIMLFNFSSNFLNGASDESLLTLVPADRVITTLEFEQGKVERIGQGWRVTPELYNSERLTSLVEYWRNAEISVLGQGIEWQSSSSKVILWFAGQAQPVEYQFMQLADKTLVKIEQNTYLLTRPSYKKLMLSE